MPSSSKDIQVILVTTGNFQEYIISNIVQLLQLGLNIHVITEKKYFGKLNIFNTIRKIDTNELNCGFDIKSRLDRNFRGGFWHHCSKRFFLIYEYMKKYDIANVLHLENDVLLYNNLDYPFENRVYLTMDAMNRCIPGILYIPNHTLLKPLIKNYNFNKNDMINLANFYQNNRDTVKTFPIIDDSISMCIYNENFRKFNSIFDGAAIGQYLGGVDPRNIPGDTRGFVNETCVVKYNKYKFKWIKKGRQKCPYIEVNGRLIPINNLHIHSKNLKKFLS